MHRSIPQLVTMVARIDELSTDQPLDLSDIVLLDVAVENLSKVIERARCPQLTVVPVESTDRLLV